MENPLEHNALLGLNITLSASPQIAAGNETRLLTPGTDGGGFLLHAEASLHYPTFSQALNTILTGKKITLSQGLFAKHVVIENVGVSGGPSNDLLLQVRFSGSFHGTAAFTAVPAYDEETASIVLHQLRYNLQTTNLLLQGAKFLFAARIEKELKKRSRIPAGPLLSSLQNRITEALNREWSKGISGTGTVKDLRLLNVEALPQHLRLRASCEGSLQVVINERVLNFER